MLCGYIEISCPTDPAAFCRLFPTTVTTSCYIRQPEASLKLAYCSAFWRAQPVSASLGVGSLLTEDRIPLFPYLGLLSPS